MTPLELVQIIARGVEVGHTGRLRDIRGIEAMNRCRDMCDALGISYAQTDLIPARTDRPIRDGRGDRQRPKQTIKVPTDVRPANAAVRRARVARVVDRNARSGKAKAESQKPAKAQPRTD